MFSYAAGGNTAARRSLMQRLLALDADAARCREENTRLPLHNLCGMAADLCSVCPGSADARNVRARVLRGARAAACRLLSAFPNAATLTAGESNLTPLASHLFTKSDAGKENRCIYRPLVAALVSAAPASLSVSNKTGFAPFDMLKRCMVPRAPREGRTRTPKSGALEAAAVAGSLAELAEADPAHDPVAAFVTPLDGGDRGRTITLLKPSTIGLFREARRDDLARRARRHDLSRRDDLAQRDAFGRLDDLVSLTALTRLHLARCSAALFHARARTPANRA